jgi:hypothetical protein
MTSPTYEPERDMPWPAFLAISFGAVLGAAAAYWTLEAVRPGFGSAAALFGLAVLGVFVLLMTFSIARRWAHVPANIARTRALLEKWQESGAPVEFVAKREREHVRAS